MLHIYGNPQSHSPDDARSIAGQHKGNAKSGKDPAGERKAQIAAYAIARGLTMGRLVDAYEEALPKRPKMRGSGTISTRQAAAEIAHLRKAVATIAGETKPASEITVEHLRAILKACGDQHATARHRFGAMSRFFDWAIDEGRISVNPCLLLAKAIDTFSDIKEALNLLVPELSDWRFHDLRRTFATALGEAGISETVADAILNHRQSATRGGVLGVYQLAQRWPEQMAAMKHWNSALERALQKNSRPPQ